MKFKKRIICIVLLLVTAAMMFLPIASVYDDAVADLRKKVEAADQDLTNETNKLERNSVIYDVVYPILIAGDLSSEEKSQMIQELADQREAQAAADKENGVKKDDRTKPIPEDLKEFLVGDLTWEKIVGLNTKKIANKDKAALLNEFGIEVIEKEFNLKPDSKTEEEQTRYAELAKAVSELNDDEVIQLRINVLDAYYRISRTKERIREYEERLAECQAELEAALAE